MSSGLYTWSQTAASNANADSTINWAEGQAPSSINDSARAVMAGVAKYRDDIAGAIVTAGTSTAYTVTSYSIFDTLAHLNGQMIAFTPHTTNGATVTLNVDSLGAKPLRSSPGVEINAGTIIQGTPYIATYNNSDGAFYLQGFFGNAYSLPIGGALPYFLATAPNSSFVLPYGQAISRTTYATLFAGISTIFGTGDGSTTFNLPDMRGRVPFGADAMGGSNAGRLSTLDLTGNYLGGVGGHESHALTIAELPAHTHANSLTDPGHTHTITVNTSGSGSNSVTQGQSGGSPITANSTSTTGITITNASIGSGTAHAILPPAIICNYIMRII